MKKICICTTVSITLKSFVLPTAEYLHREFGYDVTLICNPDTDFEKSLPDFIHFIPVKMSRGVDISGVKAVADFIKIFKREKFDMVQYSTPNAACYASIAAKICNVPKRLYCQWGIRYSGLSGTSRKIFKFIEKTVCKNSTHIRAVSPLNKEFAVAEGLYKPEKAKVVGNGGTIGVDSTVYDINQKSKWRKELRKKYGIADKDFVFGFSGRISVDKGCGELLRAFLDISKNYPDAKLFVVGPFEEDCGIEKSLIDLAKSCKNIIFTGSVPNNKMFEYYSVMDVLVHPTYREGFGMVIQEAGALDIPAITTKIPGASEVMENGVSSVHIEPKNSAELIIAMKGLLEDPEKAIRLGAAAYKRTMSLYERSVMLENQGADYRELLGDCGENTITVLSDKDLDQSKLPVGVKVNKVSYRSLDLYNHNKSVIAVCGSRAMASKTEKMDFPGLKLFQLTSAGFDGVPLAEFRRKGVSVANAGGTYSTPIAETVVFGLLTIAKKIRNNPNNRHFKLQRHYTSITELSGKNILIMGAGNIGTAVADRLNGFEMNIDGYDPYCASKKQYKNIWRTRAELKQNIGKYDYIVSTMPDSSETRGFIDRDLFELMKPKSVIINVGRKAVFNEKDFYAALKKRKIGGAVLDMFEKIPNPITNKFRRLKNVVVLPGVSAISKEVNIRLKEHITKNVSAVIAGTEINNVINGGS